MEFINFKFNQVGIIHNEVLDAITKLPDFPNYTLEEAYFMGVKTQNEMFMFNCDEIPVIEYSKIKPYYEELENGADFKVILDILHKDKLISAALKKEMDNFADNINNSINYSEIEGYVHDFVNSFQANSKLTDEEKMTCWGTASVALFSMKFWKNVEHNPTSVWFNLLIGTCTTKGKWWHVVLAVGADCAGVLIGAGVGSVAGPAGSAAGAGAVGAGASAATIKALNPTPPPAS